MVVRRDCVRIVFLFTALNDFISVLADDIQYAYLNAPTQEKIYFTAGGEWRADKGKTVIIVRSLYRLKSSALAWRDHLYGLTNEGYKWN